jgi:uncharacterized protein YabE (DUF348 family)
VLRSVKYGLYGAVLAGLVAAPVVWNSLDKSVKLTVDGKSTTVTTTASNVSALLDDHGLKAGRHDLLAPTAKSAIKDGMHIVLRRGRLLHLSVDGHNENVWTTAPTVQVALSQLGYSASDFVSVSRSRRLPLDPTAIAIRTPKLMTVVHDGERETVSTTEPTVGRLLAQIKVAPDADDKLSVTPGTATAQGMTVVLQRVGVKTENRTIKLKYTTSHTKDADLTKGDTKVIKPGRNGKAQVTYAVTYVDGKATARQKVRTVTLTAPSTKVVAVGTKKVKIMAAPAGRPDPGSAKAIAKEMAAARGWGDDQYDCLVSMWSRESGWRVNAANSSGAYGIPQALPGSKMSSAGDDWETNPRTQIKWGLRYIAARYDTPCGAWSFWQDHNYY